LWLSDDAIPKGMFHTEKCSEKSGADIAAVRISRR
jgi:hypothetical protein